MPPNKYVENSNKIDNNSSNQNGIIIENNNELINFNDLEFGNKISYLLNCDDFKNIYNNNDDYNKAIGYIIEFFIIFKSLDFDQYLDYAKKMKISNYNYKIEYINLLIEKKLNYEDTPDEVFDYLYNNFINNGYYYHCFNGKDEESIKIHGLSKNIRSFDHSEIEEIINISLRAKLNYRHFDDPKKTWFPCYLGNSVGRISFSSKPDQISHYLECIPEWYSVFISRCFETVKISEAFRLKQNYSTIQNDIYEIVEKFELDLNDKIYLLKFIEKYWNLYTYNKNLVALVKKNAINTFLYEIAIKKSNILEFYKSNKEIISLFLTYDNTYFDKDIDISPNNIIILTPGTI